MFLLTPAEGPPAEMRTREHKHQQSACWVTQGGGFSNCGRRGSGGGLGKPRALVCAEVREEVVPVREETALLEKPIFEDLFLSEHHGGEQFSTCSVSVSDENTIRLDSSVENVVRPER